MRYVRVLDNITKNITKDGVSDLGEGYASTQDLNKADAILIRASDINNIEFPKSLRCIARSGSGVNNIPYERAARQGIVVFNAPGANSNAVKELVVGMMLANSRDVLGGMQWCLDHADDEDVTRGAERNKKAFVGHEVAGKKVGIVGAGNIGSKVANAMAALGARVFWYDPYLSVEHALAISPTVTRVNDLDDLVRDCDYLTLHVPSKEDTHHMIGEEQIYRMNKGAMLLNYARADIVDEQAVAHALEIGHLGRFCTDFATPATMHMKNAVVTPHMGACTAEAEQNCAHMAIGEMKDYLRYGTIRNSVNYPDADFGKCRFDGRICVLHANKPNMIGQITSILADADLNIQKMANEAQGDNAYTMVDFSGELDEPTTARLRGISGVYLVRVLEP